MLRYAGICLAALFLAVGVLSASSAAAQGRRTGQWQQKHAGRWERRYVQGPPYGRAYGYRANRADLNRNGIPDYRERSARRLYRSRVAGSRTVYRDFDRDGIPDFRDRDIDGDGVPNYRDRYDWNRRRW